MYTAVYTGCCENSVQSTSQKSGQITNYQNLFSYSLLCVHTKSCFRLVCVMFARIAHFKWIFLEHRIQHIYLNIRRNIYARKTYLYATFILILEFQWNVCTFCKFRETLRRLVIRYGLYVHICKMYYFFFTATWLSKF